MAAEAVKCTLTFNIEAVDYNNMEGIPVKFASRSASGYDVSYRSAESTTECTTVAGGAKGAEASTAAPSGNKGGDSAGGPPGPQAEEQSGPAIKLHALVQHIYAAQARVQLEANEIKKSQSLASSAQKSLEEAASNVRVITAALQTAQQEVAAAAVRAQSAQLQLAAHDQLLFAARQKVDALSSQMVGLQAEDGVNAPKLNVNIQQLLQQLKEPLPMSQTPTPIPAIDKDAEAPKGLLDYSDYYNES